MLMQNVAFRRSQDACCLDITEFKKSITKIKSGILPNIWKLEKQISK